MYKFLEQSTAISEYLIKFFKKIYGSILSAIFTTMAFSYKKKLPVYEDMVSWAGTENPIGIFLAKLNFVFPENNILYLILVIGLVILYNNFFSNFKKWEKVNLITACMFSLIMLIGNSFMAIGSWELIFKDGFQFFISVVYFLGYLLFFYVGITYIFIYFDNWRVSSVKKTIGTNYYFIYSIFNEYPFRAIFFILLLAWSPYLVLFYPGSVDWDVFWQLKYFYGEWAWSNHHPVVSTLIIGLCMKLGNFIHSDNFGIFIYTLLQTLVLAAAISFSFVYMQKVQTPIIVRKFLLLFCAFWPLFPGYAQYVTKDTLYAALLVIYSILFIKLIQEPENWLSKKYEFFLVSFFLCLIRNNGIYVVLLSGIVMLFMKLKKKFKVYNIVFLLILLGLWTAWSNIIIPGLGIDKDTSKEALSIPFQQTARYVTYHEVEVTEEERNVIDKVFDYNRLTEKYRPETSDGVRNIYKYPSKLELLKYFQVWLKQFVKHPGTYIQATIHNTYGYFYPDVGIWFYNGNAFGFRTTIEGNKNLNSGFIQIGMKEEWQPFRKAIENIFYVLKKIPGFGLLFTIGFYTWIIICMIAYLVKIKKYQAIVAYMPVIVSYLVCIASPVNRYMRYYIPIVFSIPLLIAYFLYVTKKNISKEKKDND